MTRAEADRIIVQKFPSGTMFGNLSDWLDLFIALGMLKLDEPEERTRQRAWDAIYRDPRLRDTVPRYVTEALDGAGLKIVEK